VLTDATKHDLLCIGGLELNPSYLFPFDAEHFHDTLKVRCLVRVAYIPTLTFWDQDACEGCMDYEACLARSLQVAWNPADGNGRHTSVCKRGHVCHDLFLTHDVRDKYQGCWRSLFRRKWFEAGMPKVIAGEDAGLVLGQQDAQLTCCCGYARQTGFRNAYLPCIQRRRKYLWGAKEKAWAQFRGGMIGCSDIVNAPRVRWKRARCHHVADAARQFREQSVFAMLFGEAQSMLLPPYADWVAPERVCWFYFFCKFQGDQMAHGVFAG